MALPVNQPVNEVAVFAKTASVGSTPLIAQTVAPVKGRIVRTYAVLEGTITTAPAAIAVAINGGSNIGSLSIPVGIAGSGASDVPSAAGVSKDVQEGDFISFTPSGGADVSCRANRFTHPGLRLDLSRRPRQAALYR